MPRVRFGQWTPDQPPLKVGEMQGVTVAKNCVPRQSGFGPFGAFAQLAGVAALDGVPLAALAGIDPAGNGYNFAGTASKLWRYAAGGMVDVSKAGGYGLAVGTRWELHEMNGLVIAVAPFQAPQVYDTAGLGPFEDLAATAPQFRHAMVLPNHFVGGNLYDAAYGLGAVTNAIWWSSQGNPSSWPEPGGDLAASTLSDYRELSGDGGWVMGLAAGTEVGVVFQERAVWRMDYVGPPVVYEVVRVEEEHGLTIPGLCIPFGRTVLYYSQEGWRLFTGAGSEPVGRERVDRFFKTDCDFTYRDRISWAVDPDVGRAFIAYPGQGHTGGRPNRLLVYDFALDAFSLIETELELVAQVLVPGSSLDEEPGFDMDAAPVLMDDRQVAVDAYRLGGYDENYRIGAFTGAPLQATIETGDLEVVPGMRAFVAGALPVYEGNAVTLSGAVAKRGKAGDAVAFGGAVGLSARTGQFNLRAEARYHRLRTVISGAWDHLIGLDVDAQEAGLS